MSIRTTVTLDEDVLDRVKAESRARGSSFRETLNDMLRLALTARPAQPCKRFRIKPTHMGYRPGLNYDHIESLLEFGEGESHK